jgi:hypothetical protein
MKQIGQLIQESLTTVSPQGQLQQQSDLKNPSKLTPEETRVIDLKYKSRPIKELSQEEIALWSNALIIKIHVVTGWTIPSSEELMNILIDQFEKKLVEDYGELNPDEIEFAFRSKGTVIEDWGKTMNLNLLDKVLLPYLDNRFKISETERQLNYYKRRPEFNLEKDIDWRRMIEEDYEFFMSGKNLSTFPHKYYEILVEDKFFDANVYEQFVNAETKEQDAKDEAVLLLFRTARAKNLKNLYVRA